ncbi:iron-sulfur cluster repair di-iron protein [Pontimicrobium aquaticum]|uniref:Iron-sulfur cluster repair di-iron protein n=1 Tax=Pontimicrobium aquaticum TaxID=2565367 RepID=A0A4U0EZ74_9FLAO|nr:iron-sulfur cluster repair di-iron protein [Pontimicrobium aquaticum]TJY37357.1 iron-sulfur cluster repair di-iron protein [Pontimicrobium aquaticum]
MNIQRHQIIGELVAQDYRAASVFKKHEIDFCCHGNRTIDDACKKKNIESQHVINDLNKAVQTTSNESIDFASWPLDLLVDYIEKKHHRYVEEKTIEIKPYLDKICRVHGNRHPELLKINEAFTTSVGELAKHMKKEELILFPFVRKMVKSNSNSAELNMPHFGTVENPINMMMDEHSTEGERFREIAKLSNDYTPPIDACNTYKVTFALLEEFEKDLHLHIHLENNILFPKAIAKEREFSYV